jgi:metallo-beta-lactamase family protein
LRRRSDIISTSKKDKIICQVIGGNAEGVTGSCTEIQFNGKNILFECGLIQDGHTVLANYKENKHQLEKIKPKNIDYIIIGHCHIDHIGLIPALYSMGCKAKIIMPERSSFIFYEMLLDCAYINARDVETLMRKSDRIINPLYTIKDVEITMTYIKEIQANEIFKIEEGISIRYIPSGHVISGYQAELFFEKDGHTKKVFFTSDIGNPLTEEYHIFANHFEKVLKSNIVIAESTYSSRLRGMVKKDLYTDLEKMKSVVTQYCIDSKHRVLIPSFSFDRTPFILWDLYTLFKDSEAEFKVVIDSPLANRLLDGCVNCIDDSVKDKYIEMMSWDRLVRITDPEDSKAAVQDKSPKVILSASGMLTAGRSVKWVQNILQNPNDCIMFVGYAGADTLAYKIKNGSSKKSITINGVSCRNRCQIIDLKSFSSHMQRQQLIDYYKQMNCEKIYLVHGDKEDKLTLKEDLEKELSECGKTTRIIAVNKSTKITL